MTGEVVERVARRMCAVMLDRVADDTSGGPHPCGQWLDEGEPWWTGYIEMAQAAIEAMRVPTVDMEVAGTEQWLCEAATEDRSKANWQAMIDAALAE